MNTSPPYCPNCGHRLLPESGGHPTPGQIADAQREILEEDKAYHERMNSPERKRAEAENSRRANLPPEHPDHICGMMCDGQDGGSSYCSRIRYKLFGTKFGKRT